MGLGSLLGRLVGGGAAGASYDDVRAASESGTTTLVDVREPHEFAGGHVAGSINLPLSRFDPAMVPEGRPVIMICLSGARSASAADRCRRAGRQDVSNFAGGIAVWRLQGGPLQR